MSNRECPICKSRKYTSLYEHDVQDFDSNNCFKTVRVSSCNQCGFVLNDKNISPEELSDFYSTESPYLSDSSLVQGEKM